MKYTATTFCLVIGVSIVRAASIAGRASLDTDSVSLEGSLAFPKIPGTNPVVRSFFGLSRPWVSSSNSNSNANTANGTSTSNSSAALLSGVQNLFGVRDPLSLIPNFSSFGNLSNMGSSGFSGLGILSNSSNPAVSKALQDARDRLDAALRLGGNFTAGIEQAIQDALNGEDPATALRDIVQAILDAYLSVVANCPFVVIGSRVLQEGLRLAVEVARSASNIVVGTTVASV